MIKKNNEVLFTAGHGRRGIRTPEEAENKVKAGASFIVTGTVIEEKFTQFHYSRVRQRNSHTISKTYDRASHDTIPR